MPKHITLLNLLLAMVFCAPPFQQTRALDGTEALPEDPRPNPAPVPVLPPIPTAPPLLTPAPVTPESNPVTPISAVHTSEPAPSVTPVVSVAPTELSFAKSFNINKENLVTVGRNTYFILEPGYQLQYFGEKGASEVITVLNETKQIDGVETRVIQKCEFDRGVISIVNKTYVAMDKSNNDIYMFGEDIDDYNNGVITNHDGSWTAGKDGAQFGLMLPGTPTVGQRYYQNQAPGASMDRAEVLGLNESVSVRAGVFEKCLKTEETTDLDLASKDINYYAPNVGLVIDGEYKLLRIVLPAAAPNPAK